jgi:atypical dual specificity phosphatase
MDLKIAKTLGCIVLRGNRIDEIAQSSPSLPPQKPKTPYHVTVFTKSEIQEFDDKRKTEIEQYLRKPLDLTPPVDLGVGIKCSVAFNVLFWPQGDRLRHLYGLPRKDFHITLSSKDGHDIEKGVRAITRCKTLSIEQVDQIISTCVSLASNSSSIREYALEVVRFIAKSHVSCLSEISFDKAWRLLFKLSYPAESSEIAFRYLELYPNSVAALLRAAHCCEMPQQAKQAMFMFAHAAHLLSDGVSVTKTRCIEALVRCSSHTEFGPFFLDHEAEDWKNNRTFYSTYADAFRDPDVRHAVKREVEKAMAGTELIPTLHSVASNQDVFTPLHGELFRLPRFSRWLAPFRLAVMSTPRSQEDVQALIALGITLVVTLTEEVPLPAEWFEHTPCRNVFLPVRNYQAPTNEQVDIFIKAMDDLPTDEAALIHCGGGKGRAGTFAACYLMARGFGITPTERHGGEGYVHMYPGDAIKLLRQMRPGSIETIKQETFVRDYAQYLISGQQEVAPPETIPLESESPLELDGKLPRSPSLIVCCGVPGSGKSTFASQLAALGYIIISQDELGSKTACLNTLSNAIENGNKMILDRCNPYVEDREQWLAHAFHPDNALCVWFDVDPVVCVRRADARTNHPTIAPGRAKRIVHSFVKTFVPPTKKEKFACIARVSSNVAASDLLSRLGVSVKAVVQADVTDEPDKQASDESYIATASNVPERPFIYKFPRTRHLFNIGSASRDDLILSSSDAEAFLQLSDPSTTVVVEEKVDGANLGISLDSSGAFKVQNRSHYVNSKSHAQFKKLDKWLDDHYEGLSTILDAKSSQPGRWILYGEWLFAKHSIHYTNLSDLFLAFDLFDTETSSFLSREALSERLEGTNIHQVNVIETEKPDEQSLLDMVRSRQSSYYEGVIEGAYLRRQKDGKTIDRAKIVRSDFIAGDEHWNRRGVIPNVVMEYRW